MRWGKDAICFSNFEFLYRPLHCFFNAHIANIAFCDLISNTQRRTALFLYLRWLLPKSISKIGLYAMHSPGNSVLFHNLFRLPWYLWANEATCTNSFCVVQLWHFTFVNICIAVFIFEYQLPACTLSSVTFACSLHTILRLQIST